MSEQNQLVVKVTSPYDLHNIKKIGQIWKNIRFDFDPNLKQCDAWVVIDGPHTIKKLKINCPPGNTILVSREPPDLRKLSWDFMNQFAVVVATGSRVSHPNQIFSQFGQVWHINKNYEELALSVYPPKKTKLISAITSNKKETIGHRKRYNALVRLKEYFGDSLDWYGRGINYVHDKWDAIAPYKYHLAFENGQWPHYWTEKLTDAYLAWSMPIYVGAPNIFEYFDPESLIVIDPEDAETAIVKIERAFKEDAWSKALPAIARSRKKILNEFHFFAVLYDIIVNLPVKPRRSITIRLNLENPIKGWLRRFRSLTRKMLSR